MKKSTLTTSKMIIFDYGHTLLYELNWNSERGNIALLKHVTLFNLRKLRRFLLLIDFCKEKVKENGGMDRLYSIGQISSEQ